MNVMYHRRPGVYTFTDFISQSRFDGKIKAKDAVRLINKGSTNLIKGIGKSKKDGKPYDACLILNPKGSAYVTALKFPERSAERR